MNIEIIKPAIVIGRYETGSDFGTDRTLVARVGHCTSPHGRRLIWWRGAKHWRGLLSGYQYSPDVSGQVTRVQVEGRVAALTNDGAALFVWIEREDGTLTRCRAEHVTLDRMTTCSYGHPVHP